MSTLTFAQLGLSPARLHTLEALGFELPTPIQAKAIPIALEGKDVIGCAQTGTGKTAAFVLPMLDRMNLRVAHCALVLAPTRELALQIHSELQRLAGAKEPLSVVLIGGVPLGPQVSGLRRGLPVIIATPGRLVDHLQQRTVKLHSVHTLVLDEADRMLDMGFAPQLEKVLAILPRQRQSMLFSATLSKDVTRFAGRHMQSPVSVGVAPSGTTAAKVQQRVIGLKDELKLPMIAKMVSEEPGKVLIFVRTRGRADKFAKKLARLGENVGQLHSDRSQGQRKTALDAFRSGHGRILVATDLAARGIDVTDIALVVNADVPRNPEDYVHRIGRTARAETTGIAVTFVGPEERSLWIPVERLIRQKLPMEKVDENDPTLKAMIARFAVGEPHRVHTSTTPKRHDGGAERSGRSYGGERSGKSYGGERSGKPYGGERSGKPYGGERSGKPHGGERSGPSNERGQRAGQSSGTGHRPAQPEDGGQQSRPAQVTGGQRSGPLYGSGQSFGQPRSGGQRSRPSEGTPGFKPRGRR